MRVETGAHSPQASRASSPVFIGHEIFRASSYGGLHPLRVPRVSTVMDLSRAMGWLTRAQFLTSPRAKPKALHAFHTERYIRALQEAEATQTVDDATRRRHNIGSHSNPVFGEIFRRPATAAGGSLLAGEILRDPGVVYHPAGGTHHGMPDRANGFCYLNDPALAILSLRRSGVHRIAYVDIDAHHSDGVEAAFADDMDVLQISVHEEKRWPFTGALHDQGLGQLFNLPVPRGFNDDEMALVRDRVILPAVAAHKPQAIVLQCGADAVDEDPLARLSLSNNAHWSVVAALAPLAPRYLVLGGGGYNPWSVGRLWTGVWATLAGHEVPDHLPQPAQDVLRALTWTGTQRGKTPPEHWFTTLKDPPRGGPIREEVRTHVATLAARL